MTTVKNASKEVAHWYPNLLYIWMPNSGNAAAKLERANEFAARALAAYSGYASTRKVNTPEKTRSMPAAKTALPMIGTIQCIDGYVVQANLVAVD